MRLSRRLTATLAGLAAAISAAGPAAAQPRPALEPVAAGANTFTVDLYQALRKRPGNLFLSPFNISTAFSMAASGARGETAAEMRKVLHLPANPQATDAATGRLLRSMSAKQEGLQLHFANALWLDNRFAVEPAYQRSMTTNYDSAVQRLDFRANPASAQRTINDWVAARTADRIRDLLPGPPSGPMVITSAVYMKADWADPFDRNDTREADFHPASGPAVRTPLMTEVKRLRHLDGGAFQAVEIPYKGHRQSMVVFLPKTRDGLAAFEARLNAASLRDWLRRLDRAEVQRVELTLPKYRMDGSFQLKDVLRPLGMRRAFTPGADFSGISRTPLMIDEAFHKSFVAVDEQGTEAAAATAIAMRVGSAPGPSRPPIVFRADRPFLSLVRDNASGAVLFIGRLARPSGS